MSNRTGGAAEQGATDKVKDKASDARDQVQQKAASAAAEIRETGEHLLDEGKQKARELGDRAEVMARSRADEEKERVAEGFRSVAQALRKGGQELPEDRSQYRPLLNNVADRVESVSGYLESRDVDMLTRDVRRFARDHTPLFLGGAFALGVLGARFLKSSPDAARRAEFENSGMYGYPGSAGYGMDRHDRLLPETGSHDGAQDYRSGGYSAGRIGSTGMSDNAGTSGYSADGRGSAAGSMGASSTSPGTAGAGLTSANSTGTDRMGASTGGAASARTGSGAQRDSQRDGRGGSNA